MKKTAHLISVARKLALKYVTKLAIDANSIIPQVKQTLEKTLANASTNSSLGIMPFMKMISQDNNSLVFNVTRNGSDFNVTIIQTNPAEFASKYAPLAQQVKTYLEKYLTVFPSMINGDSVDYNNFTVQLVFQPATQPIASN